MLYSAPSLSLLGFLDHAQARPAWRRVGAAQCRVGDAEWDVVDGVEWSGVGALLPFRVVPVQAGAVPAVFFPCPTCFS